MIRIFLSKEAEKFFLKLNHLDQKKIIKAIDKLQKDPLVGEKLKGGYQGLFKLRAWPYRVIYSFDQNSRTVLVVTIGHRQGVYRG